MQQCYSGTDISVGRMLCTAPKVLKYLVFNNNIRPKGTHTTIKKLENSINSEKNKKLTIRNRWISYDEIIY